MSLKKKIRHILLKTHILQFFFRIINQRRFVKVPIDQLCCQEKAFSELLEFSGKPIHYFPPCQFFQMALTNPKKAREAFSQWLYKCLNDKLAYKVAQSEGGWQNGSLMNEIIDVHHQHNIELLSIEEADSILLMQAIDNRVDHYLGILTSVKVNGFKRNLYPPIYCQVRNDYYFIENGHHRISALYVLGYENVEIIISRRLHI